jgi:hypothetical protein
MQFVNFGNDQTFHCFHWLIGSGEVDIDALISKAMARVEFTEEFKEGIPTSWIARDILADLLEDKLSEWRDLTMSGVWVVDGG